MSVYERKIPQWKIDAVGALVSQIEDSQMVGLVNVEGVGAKQLHGIRDSLRGSATIRMARNTLMIRAIEQTKLKGIKDLTEFVTGPVAFIFSNQDPFTLSKFLSDNKAAAPAKGGQVSPKDIVVPAMNTGVAPGPFISELAALKIPSRVKGGVIHITDDVVAVKEGGTISNAMAQMLTRLGIEPMELQLKLIAAFTEGEILTADSFEIDLEEILGQVVAGHQLAVNLSINIGYPTEETMALLVAKAGIEARSLALNISFFSPDLLPEFLSKASGEAFALASALAQRDPETIPAEVLGQVHAAAAAVTEDKAVEPAETEEEPEEDEDDEEAVAGIGGLFG
ncbi:MAG: 50S ribosomal protein L10 [Candidatus Thorarchaeota archaeon]|nr:MAG: 50S ribosomal protein L10 [Candidatus Thorarchaeota archaeon]